MEACASRKRQSANVGRREWHGGGTAPQTRTHLVAGEGEHLQALLAVLVLRLRGGKQEAVSAAGCRRPGARCLPAAHSTSVGQDQKLKGTCSSAISVYWGVKPQAEATLMTSSTYLVRGVARREGGQKEDGGEPAAAEVGGPRSQRASSASVLEQPSSTQHPPCP